MLVPQQASAWLNGYSESSVKILTSVSATNTETGATAAAIDEAVIRWRHIPEDVVDRVIRKGAVYQCAGAVDVRAVCDAPAGSGIQRAILDTFLALRGAMLRCRRCWRET